MSQLIEKLFKHRTPGFLVFIDLCKAYDSVPREALWRALEVLGAPRQLVRLVKAFHDDMSARICVSGGYTSNFAVNNGLRQGCSIAPVLFNLYFSLVMEKWRDDMDSDGIIFHHNINGNLFNRPRSKHAVTSILDLEFADDAVLFSLAWESAQTALRCFVSVASSFGLNVNLFGRDDCSG